MKTVTSGAHYTTVTVDTAEAVKFSFPSTSLSVEAAGGDITVALTETAQAGDDGTITVPDGESRMFIHHRMNVDTYYLTGSGTAKLYASNMGDVNPFKAGKRGGDSGGDNTHYKGTTTTPLVNGSTTNPIVIDGESYTAVFGDVVVYGYTEFVFDGTAWSEFGRPFDTTPTQGSMNAVTSGGVASLIRWQDGYKTSISLGNAHVDSANFALGFGDGTRVFGHNAVGLGHGIMANKNSMFGCGRYNKNLNGSLFEVGNGANTYNRSNILEANQTSVNINGDIKINNVAIPTPYTTMPTITESMLGQIAMYVGATGGGYTQGCFYVAATDGAAEPTYSWVRIGGTLGLEEVVLWENDGTTNPQTITLSEAITNFDEVVFCISQSTYGNYTERYVDVENAFSNPVNKYLFISVGFSMGGNNYTTWVVSGDGLTLTKRNAEGGANFYVSKVIGRRYTKVSPTGYRRVTLWENEGTTNPDTITLSEAWSNFDELVIVTAGSGSVPAQYETTKHTSVMAIGSVYTLWYNSETTWGTYSATSDTVFTKLSAGGDYHIAKIIGIKY